MSATARNIGALPRPGTEYSQADMFRLINALEQNLSVMSRIIQAGYQPSNVTTTRAFDADATSLDELADVLGTLIEDMKERGYLGP